MKNTFVISYDCTRHFTLDSCMDLGTLIVWVCLVLLLIIGSWFMYYTYKAPEEYTPYCFGTYPFMYPSDVAEYDCPNCKDRTHCMEITVTVRKPD